MSKLAGLAKGIGNLRVLVRSTITWWALAAAVLCVFVAWSAVLGSRIHRQSQRLTALTDQVVALAGRVAALESTTAMQAANPNSRLREGTKTEPIPGFWISPSNAGFVITRMEDAGGPFVRVQATRAGSYLVLNGQEPLARVGGVPATLRGQIRAHSAGKMTLTLYDVVDADGKAATYATQLNAAEQWTTVTARIPQLAVPDSRDNFSLGLVPVASGDWFDVRELSLFVSAPNQPGQVPATPTKSP